MADDYEFWLRMALQCDFDFVDDIVLDYRVGINQIETRFSVAERTADALRIQRDFVGRLSDGKYPRPDVSRRGIAKKYADLGDFCLGAGRQVRALVRISCPTP